MKTKMTTTSSGAPASSCVAFGREIKNAARVGLLAAASKHPPLLYLDRPNEVTFLFDWSDGTSSGVTWAGIGRGFENRPHWGCESYDGPACEWGNLPCQLVELDMMTTEWRDVVAFICQDGAPHKITVVEDGVKLAGKAAGGDDEN